VAVTSLALAQMSLSSVAFGSIDVWNSGLLVSALFEAGYKWRDLRVLEVVSKVLNQNAYVIAESDYFIDRLTAKGGSCHE
jgi:hypothetical protein